MLKRVIEYMDLDGNPVTDEFYFNFSKPELVEMLGDFPDGLEGYLKMIASDRRGGDIIRIFRDILSKSVGRRSEDGKRFIKDDEARSAFMDSDAYSVMFMELVTNAQKAAEFFNGVIPKDLVEQVKKAEQEAKMTVASLPHEVNLPNFDATKFTPAVPDPPTLVDYLPSAMPKKPHEYTEAEISEMPHSQFVLIFGTEQSTWPRNALLAAIKKGGVPNGTEDT